MDQAPNRQARALHSHAGPLGRRVPGSFRPSNAQVEAWKRKGTVGIMEKLRCREVGNSWKATPKPPAPHGLMLTHPQDSEGECFPNTILKPQMPGIQLKL